MVSSMRLGLCDSVPNVLPAGRSGTYGGQAAACSPSVRCCPFILGLEGLDARGRLRSQGLFEIVLGHGFVDFGQRHIR